MRIVVSYFNGLSVSVIAKNMLVSRDLVRECITEFNRDGDPRTLALKQSRVLPLSAMLNPPLLGALPSILQQSNWLYLKELQYVIHLQLNMRPSLATLCRYLQVSAVSLVHFSVPLFLALAYHAQDIIQEVEIGFLRSTSCIYYDCCSN